MAAIAKSLIPQNLREPEPLQPIVMPESAPEPLPPTPQPQVQLAPKVPTPLDQQIQHDQQKLEKIHFQQENPWGTAQNHPGVGGKIAHVLSVAGNIAGDIFAPGVMARIPGTQMNRQVEEDETNDRLSKEQEQQSQGALQQANTEHLNAETPEVAPNAASARNYQGAEVEHLNAQTDALNNPPPNLANAYAFAVDRVIKAGGDPAQDPIVQHLSDAITSLQKQPANTSDSKTTSYIPPGGTKPMEFQWNPKTNRYDIPLGEHYERPITVNTAAGERADRNAVLKAYEPTLQSAERMNVMTDAYEKAIKDHDQQAMLNLLANHLGMTMGLQKGARMTKDIIHEAQQSQPFLQGIKSHFDKDGYLSGVTLSPQQMRQMVNLGQQRYIEDAKSSRAQAQYIGAKDDGPERIPGKATIRYYLGLANGDQAKAKHLAQDDGWTVK
jgi:hypothetical protein